MHKFECVQQEAKIFIRKLSSKFQCKHANMSVRMRLSGWLSVCVRNY